MEILDLYQKEMAEWNTIQLLLVPLPPKGRKSDMAHDLHRPCTRLIIFTPAMEKRKKGFMKERIFFYICFLMGLLMFSGCSKESFENDETTPSYVFRLTSYNLTAGYREDFTSVYLDANADMTWKALSSVDWLTVSPASGTGAANIKVGWLENPLVADREGTVVFSNAQRKELTLTVKQGQKHADLFSTRAIVGNLINNEMDSVEFIFDRPLAEFHVSSNSERYLIADQVEKMDEEGFRWRLPLKVSNLGSDMELFLAYTSANDRVERKIAVSVPFYQKKYMVTEENGWITYSILSLDKKSLWIALDDWDEDKRRLVQLSLEDMTEMKSVKMPYAATHLCMNPYNGLLYVMGDEDYFCVVDPASGAMVKRVQITETSPYAHPQYPTNYASEVAFTKDGFGILRLVSQGSTGMEWRYIDSANGDKITLSGYDTEHKFEHLYVNYDQSRIYASMYPSLYSPMEWMNRQQKKPVQVNIHSSFKSDKYFAGGNLVDLQMSPFANKAFICTAPGSECVVTLEPLSYSEVLEEEARDSKCAWDELVSDRDYVYQVCSLDGCLELYDMTDGRGIFGSHHRFVVGNDVKSCYFLPATDQLVVTSYDGVWVFDAAAMKAKKI